MATNGTPPFALKEEPIENQRPLSVVVIGAGFAGIYAAIRYVSCSRHRAALTMYRIPERLRNIELVVYEKNEGVGGVWYVVSGAC